MIQSIRIENFRCFRRVVVHDLRRINILVGKNASGKTAFLEAVFLARAGAPQIALKLRHMRGLGRELELAQTRQSYEALWKDLFHQFDQNQIISIELSGSGVESRLLQVFYDKATAPMLPFGKQAFESEHITEIAFKWTSQTGEVLARPRFTDKGLVFEGTTESEPAIFFTPSFRESPAENAKRFSELSKQKREDMVLDTLRHEYPFVESLSVEIDVGTPTVYASMKGIPQKLPVPLVSDGVNKLLGLLLGVATYSRAVVLIDEVENGFFHARLPNVWRLLLKFCIEFDVQIFGTVHSRESLESAAEAMEASEDEFCLLRTEQEDGQVQVLRYSGSELAGAVRHGFEIR